MTASLGSVRGARLLALALAVLLWPSPALAETLPDDAPLPAAVEALLERGDEAARRGLDDPTPPHPDHADWRVVLDSGREALDMIDHAVTRRYLARAYALTGWSVRALDAFDELVAAGHPLDVGAEVERLVPEVPSLTLYRRAAAVLAFSRYQAGDAAGAERTYARWLEVDPEATEPLRWLGRLALERGDPEGALPYWERLVELSPEDDAAAYALRETRRELAIGPQAAASFRRGSEAYEAGDLEAALDAFEASFAANPEYLDAAVWAGRTALELGRAELAVDHWSLVVRERPDDAGAAYFLRLAQDQAEFGVTAGRGFHDGLAAYERGELEEALDAFEAAVAANGSFTQAWVWVARVRQETGLYEDAVRAWERVIALDPSDDRARYFAALAQQQQGVRPEAGEAFARAVSAYERADFATAEELLQEVVRIDPDSATAWAWLGRVAFGERRYAEAAIAYGRASELDPQNEDLAFFAAEAAALAAPPERDDPEPGQP